MNYPIYITYKAIHTNPDTVPRHYVVRAGSKDQANLLAYHSKHRAVSSLREIKYRDMNQTA